MNKGMNGAIILTLGIALISMISDNETFVNTVILFYSIKNSYELLEIKKRI